MNAPRSVGSETIDYGDPLEVRAELDRAIEDNAPVKVVMRIYVRLVVARMKNKVHAATKLGVDRRSIQRWARLEKTVEKAA